MIPAKVSNQGAAKFSLSVKAMEKQQKLSESTFLGPLKIIKGLQQHREGRFKKNVLILARIVSLWSFFTPVPTLTTQPTITVSEEAERSAFTKKRHYFF